MKCRKMRNELSDLDDRNLINETKAREARIAEEEEKDLASNSIEEIKDKEKKEAPGEDSKNQRVITYEELQESGMKSRPFKKDEDLAEQQEIRT